MLSMQSGELRLTYRRSTLDVRVRMFFRVHRDPDRRSPVSFVTDERIGVARV